MNQRSYSIVWATRMMSTYLRFHGQAKESTTIMLDVLPLQERFHGPKDLDLIRSISELAATHNYEGDMESAMPLVTRVVAVRKELLGERHPHYLNSLVSMASIKELQEKYGEAEALIKEALEGFKTLPDERNYPRALAVQNDLGLLYAVQERHEKAIKVYEKTLNEVEQSLALDDHTSITLIANLADAHYQIGHQHEAQLLYERALHIREAAWGLEHPDTVRVMQDLASIYQLEFEWDDAERIRKKILELQRQVCGEEHPMILIAMGGLAHVCRYQESYEETLHLQQSVVNGMQDYYGSDHLQTLRAQHDLAMYNLASDKLDEAGTLFDEVLVPRKRLLGDDHDDCLNSFAALGELRYK